MAKILLIYASFHERADSRQARPRATDPICPTPNLTADTRAGVENVVLPHTKRCVEAALAGKLSWTIY